MVKRNVHISEAKQLRKTYDDVDNTIIQLFTVLTTAICCEFPSLLLAENFYTAAA
jgi:hypothetical protein